MNFVILSLLITCHIISSSTAFARLLTLKNHRSLHPSIKNPHCHTTNIKKEIKTASHDDRPSSSISSSNDKINNCRGGYVDDDDDPTTTTPFQNNRDPLLAVITETDAASSPKRIEETITALRRAVTSESVDLISIRCSDDSDSPEGSAQLKELVRRVVTLRSEFVTENERRNFLVVVNGNDAELALAAGADGVHLKERHVGDVSMVRDLFRKERSRGGVEGRHPIVIVGTSVHSVESASLAASLGVDYLFVGTCFLTLSHPEKSSVEDLEGPDLPGRVVRSLSESFKKVPKVFAIGGINAGNCMEPVRRGADGVAVIREVMQAEDPESAARDLKCRMGRS